MKLVSFREGGQVRAGAVVEGRVVDLDDVIATLHFPAEHTEGLAARGVVLPATGMLRLLHAGPSGIATVTRHVDSLVRAGSLEHCALLAETPLLAPVPVPEKSSASGATMPSTQRRSVPPRRSDRASSSSLHRA